MSANNVILNRIFTKSTINEWVAQNNIPNLNIIDRFVDTLEYMSNKNVITQIYKKMSISYRNEYIYKNTMLNKLLLGRHSINTTTALTEVPVEKSKADFILINGRAVVYEIKTELDTLDRLSGQLINYYKAFENVCVITSESNCNRVLSLLKDTNVGVCVLTKRNSISTKKEPICDNSKLDFKAMFKILRKHEYENILIKHFGELPLVKPVEHYNVCLKMFRSIDITVAYNYMVLELKKRSSVKKIEFEDKVPYELKFLVYFSDYKLKDYLMLEEFLNQEYRR
jgi:hypothetical protein